MRAVPAGIVIVVLLSGLGPAPRAAAADCTPTTTDVYAQAVLADGPAAYYRLDEAAGPALCDASGNSRNGTLAARGIAYGQPGAAPNLPGSAIESDGTSQPATGAVNTGISGAVDFTLEGWFKSTVKQDQMIVAIGQSGKQNMAGIGIWSNDSKCCGGTKDWITFDTFQSSVQFDADKAGVNVFDGRWHYIAGTLSAGSATVTVYMDGRSLGQASATSHPLASPVRIGYWVDTELNRPFTGGLDEIAVYPSALSASRLNAHWAAARLAPSSGASISPSTPQRADNPLGNPVLVIVLLLLLGIGLWAAFRVTARFSTKE